MRIVFDLDETICHTRNRDYERTQPIEPVVARIQELRRTIPGAEVVIYTSRGMASCGGDVAAAERKNRPMIEKWLRDNGVEYEEIIFGKPLGDVYVDDKGMSPEEFAGSKICCFYGFSGSRVVRVGNTIVKEARNAQEQYDWYKEAERHYRERDMKFRVVIPAVYSVTLGKLYMQFLEGQSAADCVGERMIRDLVQMLCTEEESGDNDLSAYADYIESRAVGIGVRTDIRRRIMKCRPMKRRSFCHGDFSLLNIIVTPDGHYGLIYPSQKEGMSSWILDAGKMRSSLGWLDEILEGKRHAAWMVDCFDAVLAESVDAETIDAVKLAEETHLYRVWWYAKKLGRQDKERLFERQFRKRYERG